MANFAIRGYVLPSEQADRHTWSSEDSHAIALFALQCLVIVVVAMVLYLAGPALGLLVVCGFLVAGAMRRQAADTTVPETDACLRR